MVIESVQSKTPNDFFSPKRQTYIRASETVFHLAASLCDDVFDNDIRDTSSCCCEHKRTTEQEELRGYIIYNHHLHYYVPDNEANNSLLSPFFL